MFVKIGRNESAHHSINHGARAAFAKQTLVRFAHHRVDKFATAKIGGNNTTKGFTQMVVRIDRKNYAADNSLSTLTDYP